MKLLLTPPEKSVELYTQVTVWNQSDIDYIERYDGRRYVIPGRKPNGCNIKGCPCNGAPAPHGHKRIVPREAAYHFFGDPNQRDPNDTIKWEKELARVRYQRGSGVDNGLGFSDPEKPGDFFDKYLKSGLIFCPDLGTKDPAYYSKPYVDKDKVVHGEAITDADLRFVELPPPVIAPISDEEAAALGAAGGAGSKSTAVAEGSGSAQDFRERTEPAMIHKMVDLLNMP